jgi:cytochrome c553
VRTASRYVPWSLSVLVFAGACSAAGNFGTPVQTRMAVHFASAVRIQSALVHGDLDAARGPAETIWAADRIPDFGADADPYVVEVREEARNIREARSYAEAVAATGRLAAACGDCHERFDGGPNFQVSAEPTGADRDAHMTRHVWAADRLWEGLLMATGGPWPAGAAVLAEDLLSGSDLFAAAARHAERLAELGREALEVTERRDRAVVFGQVLATCGACHAEDPGER